MTLLSSIDLVAKGVVTMAVSSCAPRYFPVDEVSYKLKGRSEVSYTLGGGYTLIGTSLGISRLFELQSNDAACVFKSFFV